MDFHLEHGLRLNTKPEHESLYRWAINEIDAQGKPVGEDQIPWPWTLWFTATSCALDESIEIESQPQDGDAAPAPPKIAQRQIIRAQLRPGHPHDDGDYFDETRFSMFGTNRAIKDFALRIYAIADSDKQERCDAWGCVSYTSEIDFRDETSDDCLQFYLFVKPKTFARYATQVAHGLVDELSLSVKSVDGFYSEWSPSISTGHVKILTKGDEHNVSLPHGLQFQPPRLGRVGEAELHINRCLQFRKRVPEPVLIEEPDLIEEIADLGAERAVPKAQALAATDPRMLQIMRSLRRAAWIIVCLLALIFIALLGR